MNILFISDEFPPHHIGGAGVVAYRLAKQLLLLGHSVQVIASVRDRRLEGESVHRGIRIYNLYSDYNFRFRSLVSIRNIPILKKLKKLLPDLKDKPDIINSHNIHNYLSFHSLELLSSFFRAPIVIAAYDYGLFCADYSFPCSQSDVSHKAGLSDCFFCQKVRYVPFRRLITQRYVKRNCVYIISASNAVKAALESNGYRTVRTIYSGIDPSKFVADGKSTMEFARRWQLNGRKVVLCPGSRFDEEKGALQLIRAMGKVCRDTDACLLVPGGGRRRDQRGQLFRLCQEEGIEDRVKFIGWLSLEEMNTAYAVCDLSITPSIWPEPFGLGVIEAMAMKKPVIGTCYGGTPEIIENGVTGYVVDPFDIDLMAERIKELLYDQKRAESMGMAGYERVNRHFSLEKQAKETLDLYLSLVDRKA